MSKILHIITGLDDGGAEGVLFRLVTFDAPEQHVVVSLGNRGKYGPLLEEHNICVFCLNMPRGRITLYGLRKLWTIINREQPKIIQTWMYHANFLGGIVARISGIKSVFWGIRQTALVPGKTSSSTRLVNWICARISHFVPQAIISCAHESQYIHVVNGYNAKKFTVIPNGYDLSVFFPDIAARKSVREELDILPSAEAIGLVGRWDPQKDHANLITAVQLVRQRRPNLHLVLAGSHCDTENDELKMLLNAAKLEDRVHLLGRRSDMPALMNALDIHVLSSSFGEAFPNVVAEAMACGTPCVVTQVGDAAQIVGGTGWTVPPNDSGALAKAIEQALDEKNHTHWKLRKSAARQRIVDEFSLQTMVGRYREVWEL